MISQFINTGQDERILEHLFKSIQEMDVSESEKNRLTENLYKSLSGTDLVEKEVIVHYKSGKIGTRRQKVKANKDVKQPTSSHYSQPTQQSTTRKQLPATPHRITEKTKHLVEWDGKEFPEHIKKLSKPIPPTWRNLMISPDPKADLLAIGKDDRNRTQYIYSDKFTSTKSKQKFTKVKAICSNSKKIYEYISKLDDKESSDCLKLIFHMGIRPGSTSDTKSLVKAYGASTLKGQHVVQEDGNVYLRFVGKKGVQQNHLVSNKELASMLVQRKQQVGNEGDLFNTTSSVLRDKLKPLGIKPKDLRTRLAVVTASDALSSISPVTDAKQFAKIRNSVGELVSEKLGNQRTVALSSYIDPDVFKNWSPQGYKNWEEMERNKKGK